MRRVATRDDEGLIYVVWEITLRCDLACKHCGSRAGKTRASELSTEEALEVVGQLAAMGAREVTLIGGEAYLRDDWCTIARAIVESGMRCSMTSGGRGITRERANEAKRAGISNVSISVDGLQPAHDRQRGLTGSFDAAMQAIEVLRDAEVPVTANTQLNRLSFPDLDALLDRWVELELRAWQMQMTVPMGRAAEHTDWLFQPYELLTVYPKLAELAERGRDAGVLFWPANNIGYYGPYETLLRGRGVHRDRVWSGCVAGKHALGIESDGTIKGCPSLPTEAYGSGNVREHSIQTLWDETSQLRFVRDRTTDDLWGYCKTCYYAEECRAGCTWTSHVFFGRPGNNLYCHHRALDLKRRGLRERVTLTQRAPGTPFDHGRFDIALEPWTEPAAPTARRGRSLPVAT